MLAYIGALALAVCAIPLAWSAWKNGYDDTNTGLLVLWTFGEVALACSYYTDPALLLNYLTNIACLSIVWAVRLTTKKE